MRYLTTALTLLALAPLAMADDALDAVNRQRAARGLPAFLPDPGLSLAAQAAAEHRASRSLFGHTNNDFQFLPRSCSADAAGCAAYPASYGFMACATYDRYTYAGAASVLGRDGKLYHHLFVRNSPPARQYVQQERTTTTTTTKTTTKPVTPAVAVPPPVAVKAASSMTIRSSYSSSYSASSAVRGRIVRTPLMDRAFGPPKRPALRGLIKIGIIAGVLAI